MAKVVEAKIEETRIFSSLIEPKFHIDQRAEIQKWLRANGFRASDVGRNTPKRPDAKEKALDRQFNAILRSLYFGK